MFNFLPFQITQLLIIAGFLFFISDLRKKEGSKPLMDEKLVWAMKFCYLVPISIYVYTIVTLGGLSPLDYGALSLTFLGTVIVIKAKVDLGKYHVWTGYCRDETKLVIKGIYKWIRHPIYVGIFLFIFGSFLTVIPNAYWFLLIPQFLSLGYIMVFLILASKRETIFLEGEFEDQFTKYREQVHPFLPIQKYSIDKRPDYVESGSEDSASQLQ